MMDYIPLGSIVSIKGGKRLPAGVSLSQIENDHPYIRVRELNNVRMLEKTVDIEYVDDETQKGIARYIVDKGDIVISIVGTIGLIAMVGDSLHHANLTENCVRLTEFSKDYDSLFLYYYLISDICQDEIKKRTVGAVQPKLPLKNIAMIPVPKIDLQTQKRIAKILSSLDGKIEVNNQINRNLEEQIQALYRFYFEGNKKRTITRGKLKDICVYVTEKTSVSELTLDNYFSTENLLTDKRGATKASGLPQTALTTKCVPGNILVSNIRPYFKKLLFCDKEGGCSTDVLCFQANTPQLTNFLYSTLYFDSFFDYMTAGSKGTKMPRGDKAQIMEYPIPIPAPDLLAEFNRQVGPMIKLCQKSKKENTILSQTRDTLLPKLISGEFA